MNIQLQFALTEDDYVEFQRAFTKHRRSLMPRKGPGRAVTTLIGWLIIIVIALFVYALLSFIATRGAWWLPLASLYVAAAAAWGLILFSRRSSWLYRRLAANSTKLGTLKTAEITDAGITIRLAHACSVMQWPHFIRCIETTNTFLLFEMPRLAHILPKRAFPSLEAMQEFRAFAQAHIGNQPIGFPVQPPAPVPPVAN
jgi:YcxB-like protein